MIGALFVLATPVIIVEYTKAFKFVWEKTHKENDEKRAKEGERDGKEEIH